LKGLLIGNGWISPPEQYEAYLTFAYEKGLVKKGSEVGNKIDAVYEKCKQKLSADPYKHIDNGECEEVLQYILRLTMTKNKKGDNICTNMYDVRLTDTYPSCGMNWPPDLVHVNPYLRRSDVLDALHINKAKSTGWTECNGAVGAAMTNQKSVPSVKLLPDLLKEMDILLFSGAEDLICNHKGTESFISNMEWNGGKGFEITPGNWAPRQDWTFEGEAAGFWQQARNLTYVLFHNSSHMVPFDYPRRTRDMLDRFIGVDISTVGGQPGQSLLDGEKLPDTTVGGATNNTASDQAQKDKDLNEAKWAAYQKSGELVLAIVAIGAAVWGFFVWRARRRRTQGYQGLATAEGPRNGGLESFRNKRTNRDVEAGDFDESELDDLHVQTPTGVNQDHYSVGSDSEDDGPNEKQKQGGQSSSS
jgi:carboxypeptidase D